MNIWLSIVFRFQKAESQLAYELQAAKIRQKIRNEEIQIDIVERRKQIEIESQEVERKDRELQATVKLPADAENYRVQMIAEGKRTQTVEIAKADAERIKKIGMAEASAIELVGKAEAEKMRMKAAVYKQYGDAAIMSIVLESLPKVNWNSLTFNTNRDWNCFLFLPTDCRGNRRSSRENRRDRAYQRQRPVHRRRDAPRRPTSAGHQRPHRRRSVESAIQTSRSESKCIIQKMQSFFQDPEMKMIYSINGQDSQQLEWDVLSLLFLYNSIYGRDKSNTDTIKHKHRKWYSVN